MESPVIIDLEGICGEMAKLASLKEYVKEAQIAAGEGRVIILTGAAPVWLYLSVAHSLHGKARRLMYRSPTLINKNGEQVDVVIFDHDAF